ncbi:MAG: PilZ domain-containing protein [Dissulfurispiraceae bacterium]
MELREFFRVDAIVPMLVRPIAAEDASRYTCYMDSTGFDKSMKSGLLSRINISGAGICFDSAITYSKGDLLEIRLMLEDVYPGIIALCAKVLRVEGCPKHYCVAVRYECMDEDIRELIVKFVFQRERILIQEKRVGWL